MRKLKADELNALIELDKKGVKRCYRRIRRHYRTWYVRLFRIADILAWGYWPSYWYKSLGDCTETQAIKDDAVLM